MLMNATDTPLIAVSFFALWTVILSLIVPIWRIALVGLGRARVDDFTPGDAHGSPIYWRTNRAHVNAVENLVVFASLAICGIASGVSATLFGQLCMIALAARVVQSVIHIASGATAATALRCAAFLVQIICFIGIAVLIIQRFS